MIMPFPQIYLVSFLRKLQRGARSKNDHISPDSTYPNPLLVLLFYAQFFFFYLKDFFIFSLSGIVSLGMMVAPSMIMPSFGTQSCSYPKHDYLDQAHSPTSMLSTILVLLAWPCSPWLFELTWFIFSCRLCWRSTLLQSLLRDPWVGDPAPNRA